MARHNLHKGRCVFRYSRAFFELQWQFAERIAALSGKPLEAALLHYTNFYIRFGLGRDFDASHPVWRIYIDGLAAAAEPMDWTWRFFLTRPPVQPPSLVASFGCFSYSDAGHCIRIHFANAQSRDISPLSRECIGERRAELRALFGHVRQSHSGIQRVCGTSWLYNLPAYCRPFPREYVGTARESAPRFRNMPLWGQFLDRRGDVRPRSAEAFVERFARQSSMLDIAQCFPLRALTLEAPVAACFTHNPPRQHSSFARDCR
jgi:hypothetical protein